MIQTRIPILLLLLMALVSGSPARAEWLVVPPRAGQVGLAVQGQYGALLKSGPLGKEFGSGSGLAVRMRYRMRYERGMGLSFESQKLDIRQPLPADTAANHLEAFTFGFDVYQMFGTRTMTTKWISAGAGLAQFRRKLNDQETEFSSNPDGVYIDAAAGLERFFWQSWAIDLSGRYLAVFENEHLNHNFRAALGLVVYAAY